MEPVGALAGPASGAGRAAAPAADVVGAAGFEAGPTLRFPCFDAFRFFGMTMVLLVHTEFASAAHDKGVLQPLLRRMDVGVAIFFVLSGFLLFRPFVARLVAGKPQVPFRTFLRRRVLRVIPGYWFALTFVVLFLGQTLHGLWDAFLYYFLLFPYASDRVALGYAGTAAIPQAWSLTAEFAFYFMLPALALVLARVGRGRAPVDRARHALVAAVALYLGGQLFRVFFLVADPSWQRRAVIWAPNWVDFFALGMAMAVVSVWVGGGGRCPRVLDFLGRHAWVSWSVAAAVAASFTLFEPPETPGVLGAEYWFRWFLFGVFSLFLLIPAMFGDQDHGLGRRVLRSRVLVSLGTVSLGFYLFHLAFLHKAQEWTDAAPFQGSFVKLFWITFVGAVGMAYLSYFVVEQPFLRIKDRPLRALWQEPAPVGRGAGDREGSAPPRRAGAASGPRRRERVT